MYQNIRCLVSENSRIKIDYLRDYAAINGVLIFNITETWLDGNIVDDAKINGYNEYRCDRVNQKQGGTVIYTKENLECKVLAKVSRGKCEMIAINIVPINTINIVIYRPPKITGEDFNHILTKLEEIFINMTKPEPTIILSGDFNFPFIKWRENANNGCISENIPNINATIDEKLQFKSLCRITNKYNLIQTIQGPTREENGSKSTLDLIYTNDISLFTEIEISKSCMSDHHFIEISTSYDNRTKYVKQNKRKNISVTRSYDFFSDKIDEKELIKRIENIPWEEEGENKNTKEYTEYLFKNINETYQEMIPKKKEKGNDNEIKIPIERKRLLGRLKMLKRGKRKAVSEHKKEQLSKNIQETEQEIINQRRREKLKEEKKIIESVKNNPKVLYAYVNKENKRHVAVGPFKVGDDYIYNDKKIGKMLVGQYREQFTENTMENNKEELNRLLNDIMEEDLTDIHINEKDIIDAINEVDENSSAGPEEVPAVFLKMTKEAIAKPLKILFRKSLDEGVIPDIFKLAHITPIYKGGAKTKPEQYRPVSLTSHIMKVFERVMKKKLLNHLKQNNLINEKQYGFVPGRSTQSQLLAHYKDIYEAMEEGVRVDTVFLDFAKAFDKVDHSILMSKVIKHKIKGKLGRWIMEFLNNRKFIVIANGTKSEPEDVLSGVPQGTVLAAILFIIMISDIDEKIKQCIVRCFADDTKVSNRIKTERDKKRMQEDLNTVYKWAQDNSMTFNCNKFEQLSYGEVNGVTTLPYKNSANEDIISGNTVKDLGILTNRDLNFKEHIDNIVTSSRIKIGIILRTFITRDAELMIKLFNTYVRSKLEYCCSVWSPNAQGEINAIERIQKSYSSKIDGMEGLDYHQRLKELRMYSLERRRERYLIIYAWQMLEDLKENVLDLKSRKNARNGRKIWSPVIRWSTNGNKLKHSARTKLFNSTGKKMERLFNAVPLKIRNIEEKNVETFKKYLDKWLRTIPDTPRIDDYGGRVAADSNSIIAQAAKKQK